jgi:tRNA(Ile)-lysidine synthase
MIRLACKVPRKVTLACSGGKDSMAALAFLLNGKRDLTVAYYNHGTHHGQIAENFLRRFCFDKGLELVSDKCDSQPPPGESKEAFWREQRYEFFKKIPGPIITAHHLDDAVEWWIFSSLRGDPKLIPVKRGHPSMIRPFLTSSKDQLHRHLGDFLFVEDPSNKDVNFARNYIRHELGPMCLNVNPGLYKTVKKMYMRR